MKEERSGRLQLSRRHSSPAAEYQHGDADFITSSSDELGSSESLSDKMSSLRSLSLTDLALLEEDEDESEAFDNIIFIHATEAAVPITETNDVLLSVSSRQSRLNFYPINSVHIIESGEGEDAQLGRMESHSESITGNTDSSLGNMPTNFSQPFVYDINTNASAEVSPWPGDMTLLGGQLGRQAVGQGVHSICAGQVITDVLLENVCVARPEHLGNRWSREEEDGITTCDYERSTESFDLGEFMSPLNTSELLSLEDIGVTLGVGRDVMTSHLESWEQMTSSDNHDENIAKPI